MRLVHYFLILTLCYACGDKSSEPISCHAFDLEEPTVTDGNVTKILTTVLDTYEDQIVTNVIQESIATIDSDSYQNILSGCNNFELSDLTAYVANGDYSVQFEEFTDESYSLITRAEIDCLFEENFWIAYYDKYPDSGGYYSFTIPHIVENSAIIEYQMICGGLCAYGYIVYLEKLDDTWIPQERCLLWIS